MAYGSVTSGDYVKKVLSILTGGKYLHCKLFHGRIWRDLQWIKNITRLSPLLQGCLRRSIYWNQEWSIQT